MAYITQIMLKTKKDNFFIVVADNDRDDQYLIQKAILDNGEHSLSPVYNGRQLLELLAGNLKRPLPDFILLDLNMPGLDGLQVLAEIKSNPRFENIPVFMLSAHRYEQEIERSKELGANGFYTKPLQFFKLKEIVADIFSKVNGLKISLPANSAIGTAI